MSNVSKDLTHNAIDAPHGRADDAHDAQAQVEGC